MDGQSACGTGKPCLTGQIEFPRWEVGWRSGKVRERGGEVVEVDFIKGRGKSRGVQLLPPKKARFQLQLPPLRYGERATRGPMRVQVRASHRRCGGARGTGYPWPGPPRPPLARVVGESAPWGSRFGIPTESNYTSKEAPGALPILQGSRITPFLPSGAQFIQFFSEGCLFQEGRDGQQVVSVQQHRSRGQSVTARSGALQ